MSSPLRVKNLSYLSFTSLLLIYTTMIFGVYLSSINQSMYCRGWPLCPNGLLNLPDPSYVIEYLHRILAFSAVIGISLMTIYSYSKLRNIRFLCLVAALLVIIQFFLGMFVATTPLIPLVSAGHLSIGVTLFGLVLLIFLFSKGVWRTNRFICE
jgi:heme A synthase